MKRSVLTLILLLTITAGWATAQAALLPCGLPKPLTRSPTCTRPRCRRPGPALLRRSVIPAKRWAPSKTLSIQLTPFRRSPICLSWMAHPTTWAFCPMI